MPRYPAASAVALSPTGRTPRAARASRARPQRRSSRYPTHTGTSSSSSTASWKPREYCDFMAADSVPAAARSSWRPLDWR